MQKKQVTLLSMIDNMNNLVKKLIKTQKENNNSDKLIKSEVSNKCEICSNCIKDLWIFISNDKIHRFCCKDHLTQYEEAIIYTKK